MSGGLPAGGPWVVAEGVGLRVEGRDLLADVSFSAGPGEVVALVGPNGAGKSTLLRLLAGDAAPTAGRLAVGGREPRAWRASEIARHRAVMSQQHAVTFAFTVREIVAMGRVPHPASAADDGIVDRALRDADVGHLGERDATTLSGGELSRSVFGQVLAQTPRIVLLDEPTAALDLRHQETVMATAARIAAEGCCVLVVLHDLNLAARHADRVAVFSEGRLVADGSPREVLTAARIARVYGQEVQVLPHPTTGLPLVVPV